MTSVWRLDLEYDGAGFHGWARQPGLRTVEGELRAALAVALDTHFELAVAGRTDTGVHATGQVASVASPREMDARRLNGRLNGLLPADVAVTAVRVAPVGFDARRDATSRAYEYRYLPGGRSPLRRARTLRCPGTVDVEAMRAAAAHVVGCHDFRAFTPTETQHVHFERTVLRCELARRADEVVLRIEADAFLRNMVRTIAGSLLLVGRGQRTPEWMSGLLAGADRSEAGATLPPHPLTLVAVRYPGDDPAPAGDG